MKKIGLRVGKCWVSTIGYHRLINHGINRRLDELEFAER
jgi:hypothetical protein